MVLEQFLRLLLECGCPPDAVDMLHSSGSVASELLRRKATKILFLCVVCVFICLFVVFLFGRMIGILFLFS